MTDDRPRPRYGEYAPISSTPVEAPQYPPPVVVAAPEKPEPRPRRTWDVALTAGLLLFGVWEVVGSFSQYADFGDVLTEGFAAQGMGEFTSTALAAEVGSVISIIRLVILVITIAATLLSLSRNRISFWIPLAGGVLAAIVLIVGMYIVVVGDPAFIAYVDTLQP